MFKFVLCALFAAAVAEPQFFYTPYTESYIAPTTTTITKHASSVVTTPYYSSYPYDIPHFIKKREAQFYPSTVVTPTTYVSNWASPYNYVNTNGYLPYAPVLNAHLIKKRSAGLLVPTTYSTPYSSFIAPGAVTYSSGFYQANPLYSSYVTPAHLIKKRSAAWATPYLAAPVASTYVASAPIATSYSSAILPSAPYWSGYGTFPYIKK